MTSRLVVLIAAGLQLASAADIRVVEEIAAKVNGDIVTRGEIDEQKREYEQYLRTEQHLSGAPLAAAIDEYSKNILRDKIDTLLMVSQGKELGINVDGDVNRRLAEIQVLSKISDPEKFHDYIREGTGMPFEEYKQKMANDFLVRRVVSQEIGSRIVIPEPELQKYYNEHKADYVRKEQIFLSQIVISTEGKTPQQVAAAEVKAKDIVARARKGDKFSELVAAYSDDPETAHNGGSLPPMGRGMLQPQIEAVVFKEKKGYVTDPIKTPAGLVILRVDERFEAGQATFDEVREQVQDKLAGPQMEARMRPYLGKLRLAAFLEIKDGYVDTGAAPGKDTRWHDVAQLKPQTTTKEEVAAEHRRHKHLLFIPLPGTTQTRGQRNEVDPTQGPPPAPAPAAPAADATPAPATAAAPAAGGTPAPAKQ